MKTNFKKLMMPLGVMVLAIAGAFTTMSMGKSETLMPQQGYYFVSALDRCHEGISCETDESDEICKWGTITQVGKVNLNDANCPVKLYKPRQ